MAGKQGVRIDYLMKLPQGLTVAYDDHGSLGTMAIGIFIGAGSRDEGPEQEGAAHFLEHLAFKGAGDHNSRQIAELMDGLGGEVNAYTTRDYTCFYAKVLSPMALTAWELLWDLVRNPWLAEGDLDRERNVVQEELLEAWDDVEDRCEMAYMQSLYQDHQMTHDILGTPETIKGLSWDTIKSFYRQHYTPANMLVAIAGEGTMALLENIRKLDNIVGGEAPSRLKPVPAPSHVHYHHKAEQLQILLGAPAPLLTQDEYPAALLLSTLLGGQNSSRLWQRLRETEGLVYTVSTGYNAQADWGELSIHMALNPGSLASALSATKSEVEQFIAHGPEAHEVQRALAQLTTSLAFTRETPDGRMFRLGRYGLLGQVPQSGDLLLDQLTRVTPRQVQTLAETLFGDWSRVAVGTAGNLPREWRNLRDFLIN
ncbi:MAG: insulinase family protein [Firmicutes bacterium]|nr:insulinase family protein [Bacillota bacterium]